MAVSMLTVTGLISVFQLLVATCSSVPPAEAFPHLHEEIIGFASLTLGYMGLHLEERLFSKAAIDEGLCTELHPVRLLVRTNVPLAAFNWTDVRAGVRIGGCSSCASANCDPVGVVSRYCRTDGEGEHSMKIFGPAA